ncbi:MAG: glycosyltransferase [Planctomycetota bacterium]
MHVLMLGWEFPPFITGGLGTACHGLTRAMSRRGLDVTFVLPKPAGAGREAAHVNLVTPSSVELTDAGGFATGADAGAPGAAGAPGTPGAAAGQAGRPAGAVPGRVDLLGVQAGFVSPYQQTPGIQPVGVGGRPVKLAVDEHGRTVVVDPVTGELLDVGMGDIQPIAAGTDYGGDMRQQVTQYARFCLEATRDLDFDVIHAHDWMTYPAGLLIARATGRPLVTHIHSTEFDRSGVHVNQLIYDVERRGMHGALRVIAVSQLTRNIVVRRYGVPADHVEVVYNGVEMEPRQMGLTGIRRRDKIVLYFGRITFQKGPEYFVRAAKRVLEYMDDVKFVVAGDGDQATHMIEMAAEMGIGHKVLFTGFLRGDSIAKVFGIADLYVMPSVSEPFGIAPLEAMSHDVPVLISRSSGVSEVLSHALKVDFWDTEDMANKIIAVLRHPPLSQTLRDHGAFEVRRITWDGAAERCERVYREVIGELAHAPAAG